MRAYIPWISGLALAALLGLGAIGLLASEGPCALRARASAEATAIAPAPERARASAPPRALGRERERGAELAPREAGARRVLCGQVRDARSGAPVPGARVALRRPGGERVAGLCCDAQGRFRAPGLGGPLEALALAPGYTVGAPRALAADAQAVVLDLEPGLSLALRVVRADGEALDAAVEVTLADSPAGFLGLDAPLRPDAAGRVVLRGLPPGAALTLIATCPGWARAERQTHAQADGPEEVLTLRRVRLRGEVRGADLSEDLRVEARAADSDATRSACVPGGLFALELPHGGRWWLRAAQAGASSPWRLVDPAQDGLERLVLLAEGQVAAQVQGPAGATLCGVEVRARDQAGWERSAQSDAAGGVSFGAAPGETLELVASAPSLAPARALAQAGGAPRVLRLEPLVPIQAGSFRLGAGSVRGRLNLDPQGAAGEGAEGIPFEVEFDAEGVPQLEGLPEGVWTVSFLEPADDELRAWTRELDTAQEGPLRLEHQEQAPRGRVAGRLGGVLPEGLVQVELRPLERSGERFGFLAARALNAEGGFEFGAVPPGTYQVRALWGEGQTREERVEVEPGRAAWVTLRASE